MVVPASPTLARLARLVNVVPGRIAGREMACWLRSKVNALFPASNVPITTMLGPWITVFCWSVTPFS